MPSKKKPKPSFNVPEELQSAPQAGWVYRSDEEAKPVEKVKKESVSPKPDGEDVPAPEKTAASTAAKAQTPVATETSSKESSAKKSEKKKSSDSGKSKSSSKSDWSVLDLASETISSGFETVGNAVLLATRIITAPIWMGMRLIGWKEK